MLLRYRLPGRRFFELLEKRFGDRFSLLSLLSLLGGFGLGSVKLKIDRWQQKLDKRFFQRAFHAQRFYLITYE